MEEAIQKDDPRAAVYKDGAELTTCLNCRRTLLLPLGQKSYCNGKDASGC